MSKPSNYTEVSPCGTYSIHYHYKTYTKKNGDITFQKTSHTRKLLCLDLKEKNKILSQIKKNITHNPDITKDDLTNLLALIKNNANILKSFIHSHSNL